jgi:hypothetical protein
VNSPRSKARGASKTSEEARIQHLKQMIQSGEYESREKLDIALDRLVEDLNNYDDDGEPIRGDGSGGGSP